MAPVIVPHRLATACPPDAPAHRPRVCVFTHSLELGGGELYLQELLLRLARDDSATFVVVAPDDGPLRSGLEAAGIAVHLAGMFPIGTGAAAGRRGELSALLRQWDIDVVLANTLGVLGEVEAAIEVDVPVIWAVHESFPVDVYVELVWGRDRPDLALRLRRALRRAERVAFESEATRELFEREAPGMRSVCIRYGIDLDAVARYERLVRRQELRRRLGFTPSDRILLCMGTFQARKGQLALVHAFAQLSASHPRARLVLVGRQANAYSEAVDLAVEELGLGATVRVVDVDADASQWYRCADVLVSASDVESLPRSILEAMAFGRPVLAADVFGVAEVVRDGRNGWLFEVNQEVSLLAGLKRALSCSDQDLASLSGQARRDACSFGAEGYARAYDRLVTDLAQSREGPGVSDGRPSTLPMVAS